MCRSRFTRHCDCHRAAPPPLTPEMLSAVRGHTPLGDDDVPTAWAVVGWVLLVAASVVLVAAAEAAGVRLTP